MTVYANKISDKLITAINGINSRSISGLNSISFVLFQTSIIIGNFIKISAGSTHNLTIKDNNIYNNISSWGRGSFGAIGINNILNQVYLSEITGSTRTYCKISSGFYINTVINNSGKTWSWGYNLYGQVGDNSVVCRSTPVAVGGINKTFCEISISLYHNISIDFRGKLWGWGYNVSGQLGDNSIISKRTPVAVGGTNKTFCKISAGYNQSLAIDFRGKLWAWGSNNYGQIGDNSNICKSTPVTLAGVNKTFCEITTKQLSCLAIDFRGKAWAWGYNVFGYLGTNSTTSRRTPYAVCGVNKTFCKITQGESVTYAIDKNGKIWSWGYNLWGKLGIGSTINRSTPFAIGGTNKTFCQISGGQFHALALDNYNYIWGWGKTEALNEPTIKPMLSTGININMISVGGGQSISISGNTAWTWGYNNLGSLGINLGTGSRRSPQSVLGVKKTFCQINCANDNTMAAIDLYGKIWSWGNNQYGQVGNNSVTCRSTPVAIGGVNKTFCKISLGTSFAVSIDFRGKLWAWGYNNFGQLGDNTLVSKRTPVAVGGSNKTFCHVCNGYYIGVAITHTGKIWAWGRNNNGEIGDGTKTCRSTPVAVGGVNKTFCQISTSNYYHNLAIDKNGKIWSWGINAYGGLGNNSTADRCTPVAILGVNKTFCKIAAGYYCSFGIDFRGTVWAWGYNDGTLGTNNNVSTRTPVVLYNMTDKTFCQISAGNNFTIVLDKNNNAYAWGYNVYGQLGYDYVSLTPIKLFV